MSGIAWPGSTGTDEVKLGCLRAATFFAEQLPGEQSTIFAICCRDQPRLSEGAAIIDDVHDTTLAVRLLEWNVAMSLQSKGLDPG